MFKGNFLYFTLFPLFLVLSVRCNRADSGFFSTEGALDFPVVLGDLLTVKSKMKKALNTSAIAMSCIRSSSPAPFSNELTVSLVYLLLLKYP